MLPEPTLQFSRFAELYDLIVPKDNPLRRINELIDFSFVRKELVPKYCPDNGRRAEDPVRMFKYLLLKTLKDHSDMSVVEQCRYDMSYKLFLGLMPEDDVIEPSTLCKFRKMRLKDVNLLDMLIEKTVSLAIDLGIVKSRSIIVDATHTLSRSNPVSAIDILRIRSKQLRKSIYRFSEDMKGKLLKKNEDSDLGHELDYAKGFIKEMRERHEVLSHVPAIKERLELLEEAVEDIEENISLSKDADAKVGHKTADSSFFGYKTHMAMTEERIITAAEVSSGEKGDGQYLPALVEKSRKNGIDVDTVIGDTAYSGKENIDMAAEQEIELVARLHPIMSEGFRKKEDEFDFNKDAGMYVCPAGHMAVRCHVEKKEYRGRNRKAIYYFDIEKCKRCPLRDGCYKTGAKSRTYSVTIKSDTQAAHAEFEKTERFKQKARERYKIEAKNAELKNVYGYGRAESYGMDCMRMQGAMAIFAANIKRILRLLPK